jgi:hypothetical protein
VADSGDSTSSAEVAWTCHPVRHRPVAGIFAGLFVVAAVIGAQLWLKIPLITAIGALIMVLSVLPFYVPTRFKLGDEEIEIRGIASTRTAPWSKYRSWYADPRGILLTPFTRRSRLDRLVGLNLRFDEPDRERVTDAVRQRFEEREVDAGE